MTMNKMHNILLYTFQGYYHGLETIFQSAGLSENIVSLPPEQKVTTQSAILLGSLFTDLHTCNKVITLNFIVEFCCSCSITV